MADDATTEVQEQKPAEYSLVAAKTQAGLLSRQLTEKLFGDAMTGAIEPREAIRLLELLTKAAGVLDEKPQVVVQNTGTALTLPLPVLEKVGHCFPKEEEGGGDV